MTTKSRREILAEAFDESENEGTEDAESRPVGDEEAPAETDQTSPDTPVEQSTDEGKEGAQKPPVKEKTPDEKEAIAARDSGKQSREQPTKTDAILTRAPNSWKPAEREDWAKAPPSIRAAVLRREKEIEQALGETNNIRKFSNELANIIQPHVSILQEQRTTPLAAISSLMTTAAGLYRGNQEQKANLVAQIIANYGVDIKTLDAVLSKQPIPQQAQQHQQNPNAIPPWAQPIMSFMTEAQRAKQQREQYMAAEAHAEIETAQSELPFFDDLRNDIADLMEMAANRGRTLSMKEAHALAVASNPEIKKILDQRAAASRQSKGISQTKRLAASSVRGSPVGEGGASKGAKGNTRRAALEAAWEAASE